MKPIISSKDNPLIKTVQALLSQSRQRKKLGKTVIEGTHLLDAYLNAKLSPETVIVSEAGLSNTEISQLIQRLTAASSSTNLVTVSDSLYKSIRSLGESLPIMAIIPIADRTLSHSITEDSLIIDGVQDNGNLGTLLRTASAVGIKQVICTTGTASAWSPKTLRAGMGAHFSLNIYENMTPDSIVQNVQVPMLATSSHSRHSIYHTDLTQPLAFIMGHEGQGVSQALMAAATPISLPQPNGQESLNVAIAGALCLYEMLRQRHYS